MNKATRRDIAPEMQSLYDDLDALALLVNDFVVKHVGEPRAYTIMVHAAQRGQATLTVTNLNEQNNLLALQDFIDGMKGAAHD